MATAILGRRALAQRCVPLALGASLGIGHFAYRSKTQPYRLDALSSRSASTWSPTTGGVLEIEEEDGFIDSDVLRQVSGGSVTGFLSGLFVSVFSRTLVLLMGLTIVAFSVRLTSEPKSSSALNVMIDMPVGCGKVWNRLGASVAPQGKGTVITGFVRPSQQHPFQAVVWCYICFICICALLMLLMQLICN